MPEIDRSVETLFLNEARRHVPRGPDDRPVNICTMHRWVQRGVKTPNGERVRLEAFRAGGRWATSPAAIARFFERLSNNPASAPPLPRTLSQRTRASELAAKKLDQAGI